VICGLFGKTRQAHYKQLWSEEGLVMKNAIIIKSVLEIRKDMPRIGTRKLHFMLTETLLLHAIDIGRDSLFDLLADYGMLVRKRKKRKTITTDSNHPFRKYPNMIKELTIIAPNQLWVSDITYIALLNNYCYLSLITDAYSRKIVGFCLHPTLEKEGPLNALEMALLSWDRRLKATLIHHSDRGLQYCSGAYTTRLVSSGATISMTERGDPYENAMAERINGVLKSEFLLSKTFRNLEEASVAVGKSIGIYNSQRPHGSCDYLTPDQAHLKEGVLPSKWKSKNEKITPAA
jgi:transposase InsO family protein